MVPRIFSGLCLSLSLICISVAANEGEWTSIFNGKDLAGWMPKIKGHRAGEDPQHTFIVRDGTIAVDYSHYDKFGDTFGHLFFERELTSYRLRLEYRFLDAQLSDAPGWAYKNSGVMLHSQAPQSMAVEQDFPISIEGQFLGAQSQEKHRPTGNLCTPGTLASVEGKTIEVHCTNSRSESYPGKQWVKAEFVVRGSQSVEHWINGKRVYQYQDLRLDESDPLARQRINEGLPVELSSGYISLQSESHPIEFKNIELMILNKKELE